MALSTSVKSRWLTDKETDSLVQIIHNFFRKSANIIVSLRSGLEGDDHDGANLSDDSSNRLGSLDGNLYNNDSIILQRGDSQKNEKQHKQQKQKNKDSSNHEDIWFNIKTKSRSNIRNFDLQSWETRDVTLLPPMIIETVLDLTDLSSEYDELFIDDDIIITKKKSEIVLERWLIKLDLNSYDNETIDLPLVYKKMIILFRCLYTLVGLLPSTRLLLNPNLKGRLKTKILDGSKSLTSKGRYGLSRPLIGDKPEIDAIESRDLVPVLTPIGAFDLSVSYRKNCNFHLYYNKGKAIVTHNNYLNSDLSRGNISPKDTTAITNSSFPSPSPSSAIGNMKFRNSSTSINSQTSKRRPSGRSIPIFKTGSMASSSSPTQTTHFSNVYPIPVKRNDSNSSIHLLTNSDKNDPNTNMALITSTSSKFPSSYGSKFKNNPSRNNSLEGQLITPSSNPILQNLKSRNKFLTSSFFDTEPNNSLYLDDDLNNFMKLLDSKPDLRISNNSSSAVYEDSLSNFKSLKKNNDLFIDSPLKESLVYSISPSSSPSKPPPLIGEQSTLDSTVRLLMDSVHHTNDSSVPINYSRSQSGVISQNVSLLSSSHNGQDMQYNRIRASSKCSKDSRESRGSRSSRGSRESHGSRGSIGLIHNPVIVSSSFSPSSPLGTPNPITSHSIHSMFKASAISGTSGAVAIAESVQASFSDDVNEQNNKNISTANNINMSDSSVYSTTGMTPSASGSNREKLEKALLSSSVPRNNNAVNMNRTGSIGRAHSLLRSLSISAAHGGNGSTSGFLPSQRSRNGSGSSTTGNQLKSILHNSLKNESISKQLSRTCSSHTSSHEGNITPDQLKNISYGQQVFDSEEEDEHQEDDEHVDAHTYHDMNDKIETNNTFSQENINEAIRKNTVNYQTKIVGQNKRFERVGSLSNVLNNMKHMQRRQSGRGTATVKDEDEYESSNVENNKKEEEEEEEEGEEEEDDDDEKEEEEEEDLLFEMSDMATVK
jgi:hypothetical protein